MKDSTISHTFLKFHVFKESKQDFPAKFEWIMDEQDLIKQKKCYAMQKEQYFCEKYGYL